MIPQYLTVHVTRPDGSLLVIAGKAREITILGTRFIGIVVPRSARLEKFAMFFRAEDVKAFCPCRKSDAKLRNDENWEKILSAENGY